ncbi:MAG TPA: hypothetical protein PLL69_07550, partial [Gemmatimonadales bacterium]|nr:hypothetical protein [Gemmatimonadales bacterium]
FAEAVQDEERTVLFSSQNTLDVEQIADRITFIDRGRIVADDDKEQYLDRWRRIRLELPADGAIPLLDHLAAVTRSGRTATLTTSRFGDEQVAMCTSAGAAVHAIDRMTLEEIFVATVMSQREEMAA